MDISKLAQEIKDVDNEKKVIEIKNIFIKQNITPLQEELKTSENKKELGLKINEYRLAIDKLIEEHLIKINQKNNLDQNPEPSAIVNHNAIRIGSRHLINTVINQIAQYLKKYDFNLLSGNEITTESFNFEALNIDDNHPAKNTSDTFYIDKQFLLRTHCTANSALFMQMHHEKEDIRVFSFGNVYRKDEDDATHSHQFTQVDLVWVRDDLSVANLKFLIDGLINHLFNQTLKTRYRLSYFPFTEPSFEVDVACFNCQQKGCNICKHSGWIEILGAGMLNQKVLAKAKIKNVNTAIAAGIGVERIVMLKYGISDIRDLYNNDFAILKQFPKE